MPMVRGQVSLKVSPLLPMTESCDAPTLTSLLSNGAQAHSLTVGQK